jgi:hypothetical protein
MKNKTSILVGTRHFFYALLVAVIFCGCEQSPKKMSEYFKIMEIDSCEYVVKYYDMNYFFSHKGNCMHCAERSKK